MKGLAVGSVRLWLGLAAIVLASCRQPLWSAPELEQLRSLWLGDLPAPPPDPSNRVADDARAVVLGRELFFDSRLSTNGYVSCATCHRPSLGFQDGLRLGRGVRLARRRTPTVVGAAYNRLFYWDGRKDSLWAQALAPLESPNEHGGHRFGYARTIAYHYAADYEPIFGSLPAVDWTADWGQLSAGEQDEVTRVFVNIGKAIAAYERTLVPRPTRFDTYVEAMLREAHAGPEVLSRDEIAGLKLFIGKAGCARCHNSALFTDHRLHNTGVPPPADAAGKPPDRGWAEGWPLLLADEFGCRGRWSDAAAGDCTEPTAAGGEDRVGAFKTPSLRGVAGRAPFMHAGQLATLDDVLNHYRTAPAAPIGTSELRALDLSDEELRGLIAFLKVLAG
ncbi:MAG: hypothetical protein HY699_18985 [Deltaproteobacteria bacterium]|nr:hypothetical protein [Deltaproteobacteria bacterium]